MQSNNNEMVGAALVIGVVILIAKALITLALAVGIIVATITTVLALIAWRKPLTLWGETMTPQEARAFVGRGIIGASIFGGTAVLASDLGLNLSEETRFFIGLMGYLTGSIGWEIELAKETAEKKANEEIRAALDARKSSQEILPPQSQPPADPRPFNFADWNDEDEWR